MDENFPGVMVPFLAWQTISNIWVVVMPRLRVVSFFLPEDPWERASRKPKWRWAWWERARKLERRQKSEREGGGGGGVWQQKVWTLFAPNPILSRSMGPLGCAIKWKHERNGPKALQFSKILCIICLEKGGGGGFTTKVVSVIHFKSNCITFYGSLGMRNQVETQKERSEGTYIQNNSRHYLPRGGVWQQKVWTLFAPNPIL